MNSQDPSHAQPEASSAPHRQRAEVTPTTFHPSRENILVGFVMFLISLMFAGYKLSVLFWVPFLPLIFIFWVWKAGTHVDQQGIRANYVFKKSQSLSWQEFRGIRFNKAGRAYGARLDDTQFWLPGISFNSLPRLAQVTAGRIPDPLTPAAENLDRKVQVVNKDGSAVLMDTEDYAEYEAQRKAEYAAQQAEKNSGENPEEN